MSAPIDQRIVEQFSQRLDDHPIYGALKDLHDLRCFMQHHVYSVWDFMSLIKYLQAVVAPTRYPWLPGADSDVQRFINELVLEEESDHNAVSGGYSSHFQLYLTAMQEVGADIGPAQRFIERVARFGIDTALEHPEVPSASRHFTQQTFRFIASEKPHVVAAALALGREHIIPRMFRALLSRCGVDAQQAPVFHNYLERHVQLDEDFHAPLSLRLLNGLCGEDATRRAEAIDAAELAVQARLSFWDGVVEAIQAGCRPRSAPAEA